LIVIGSASLIDVHQSFAECTRWGQCRPKRAVRAMSAISPIATELRTSRHVSNVPCVDGSGLARRIFTSQAWSVQPCVRPLGAVHMTAGHNALRGSGPGQKPAFDNN